MADASHFPIVEYESEPDELVPVLFPGCRHGWKWRKWTSVMSIDLRWIASVMPGQDYLTGESVQVSLCGTGQLFHIRCSYADFRRDWTRAKGL